MQSPRSPGSSFVRPTVASMDAISYRRCRRTFTAPATISIPRPVTSLRHYSGESHINIGAGYDVTIAEFAEHIKRCVGFEGRIAYDRSRPDGTPRKLLDSRRIQAVGWSATTPLEEGLRRYYDWFLSNQGKLRETVIEAAASE